MLKKAVGKSFTKCYLNLKSSISIVRAINRINGSVTLDAKSPYIGKSTDIYNSTHTVKSGRSTTFTSQIQATTTAVKDFIYNAYPRNNCSSQFVARMSSDTRSQPMEAKKQGKVERKSDKKVKMPLHGPESADTVTLLKGALPVLEEDVLSLCPDHIDLDYTVGGVENRLSDLQVSNAMSCVTCGITFDNREEQTQHFKADWHRFNIKQRLRGARRVTEAAFNELADNISSLSGSESSDESEAKENDVSAQLSANLLRLHHIKQQKDEASLDPKFYAKRERTKVFLRSGDGDMFSLYHAALCSKKDQIDDSVELLTLINNLQSQNIWIVIMMGGGHFAAAVFVNGDVVAHKTFHRYVVRAKAGTSQSQHDKKGSAAHSAGAQIRRHNEAALAQDITDLLQSWSEYINKCHRIFIRVATHNYPYIFNKKEKWHLSKIDSRIRSIPFPTRRATFREVKRVYNELSTVYRHDSSTSQFDVKEKKMESGANSSPRGHKKRQSDPVTTHTDPDGDDDADGDIELSSHDEWIDTGSLRAYEKVLPGKKNRAAKQTGGKKINKYDQSTEKEEEDTKFLPYLSEFYTATVVGEVSTVSRLIETHSEKIAEYGNDFNSGINLPINHQGQTLLHIACKNGHADLVTYLLSIGCDPSKCENDKTLPYLCTQNKSVRNAFRFFMFEFPDKYDYARAQIPGPLSRAEFEEKQSRESERRKEINKKKKERLKNKKAEIAKVRAEEEEKNRFLTLSDREKRALAAERRLLAQKKADVSGENSNVVLKIVRACKIRTCFPCSRCYQCAADITGKVPFEYSNNTFCSPACLKTHRLGPK